MWTYAQATGRMFDPTGNLLSTGYSGFGMGKNNPEAQVIHNVGPIPVGLYTMKLIADEQGNAIDYGNKKAPVIRLLPTAETETHGRAGFLIHGDNSTHTASEGCIILAFPFRVDMWASEDHELQVISGEPSVPPNNLEQVSDAAVGD